MTNLQILKQIEEQLNVTFKKVDINDIVDSEKNTLYSIDKDTNIIGLKINDVIIDDLSLISKFVNLEKLILSNNQIKDITPLLSLYKNENFICIIDENQLEIPPLEIYKQGQKAIIKYFEQLENFKQNTSYISEAKLIIIGDPGSGKTTFARRIQENAENLKDTTPTSGIEVNNWKFNDNKKEISVKIWDFGGQEIYHGLHQFFFSTNSLYVLVADTRQQTTDFNYWLTTVEQLMGENTPVVVVLNKKQNHIYSIDEIGLRKRFGNMIRDIVTVDLSKSIEIPNLQNIIKQEVLKLSAIDIIFPISWVEIRERINKIEDKFISFTRFREICKESGIISPKDVSKISELFTDIGIFLHFSDEFSSLRDIIFLDFNWLTKVLYSLLENKIVITNGGRITIEDIDEIWKSDELYFEKYKFIELLKKFNLIYQINGSSNFIVPEYLPTVQPYYQWRTANDGDIYQFRYLFDNYMPKGIMPKLIVALHQYIYDNNLVWHRGLNIANSVTNPDTFAEIIETYGRENRFDIKIIGKNKKELLNTIIYHFDNVLKPFKNLSHIKLVPCICETCVDSNTPHFYNYYSLLERSKKGKRTVECAISYKNVSIDELLNGLNFSNLGRFLITEKYEEFEKAIHQKFSEIPYTISKEKITESYFHSIFHTILAENGLNPVSEETTNAGRIDIHLTINETKFLFELKLDSSPEEALNKILEFNYYEKFEKNFDKIILIGVNFSSKKRNIDGIKVKRNIDGIKAITVIRDKIARINSFSISNFQGIKNIETIEIPNNTNWIFFAGENGFGKTSILRALTIGMNGRKDGNILLSDENYAINIQPDKGIGNYVFAAYGASRLAIQSSKMSSQDEGKSSIAYSIFNSDGILLNIENYLAKWYNDKDLHSLFLKTSNFLLEILENYIEKIVVEGKDKEILYKEIGNDKLLKFNQLASGFKNIIAMVGDIIVRLFIMPEKNDNVSDISGIVIIDEFENHLHPKYQKELVIKFSKLFPNVQFFVSTHSPIPLLGAPENSLIIKIDRNETESITAKIMEIDYSILLPNAILTSPIFNFSSLIPQSHTKEKLIETSDDYFKIEENNKIENEISKHFNSERTKELLKLLKSDKI